MESNAAFSVYEFCKKPRSLRQPQLVNYLQRLQTDTTDTVNTTDPFAQFDDIYTSYMRLSYCFPQPYQDLSIHNTYNNNNNDNADNADNIDNIEDGGGDCLVGLRLF